MKTIGVVGATGAITSVGLRAMDSALSHRAAAAGMREAPLAGPDGEPFTMCFQPVIDLRLTGEERALALGQRALAEVLEALGPAATAARGRLYLCLDEAPAQAGYGERRLAQAISGGLLTQAERAMGELTVEVTARGAAGLGFALPEIAEALSLGTIDLAIVGGVHTDYDPARIAALAEGGRLFAPDRLDALIPGEAAAFVAIARPDMLRRLGLPARLLLHHVATGYERARPDNDEPAYAAVGLTAAMRAALGPLSAEGLRAGWMMTDLTFETFRHHEIQAAMSRTQRSFCEPQHVDSPAQRLGYLGAAAMPLHLVLAAEACRRGFAPHPVGLSIAGSDSGERAAVLFSAPG